MLWRGSGYARAGTNAAVGENDAPASQRVGNCFWVSPQKAEPSVYRTRPQLQGVLRLRRDVSLLAGFDVDYASQEVVSHAATPASGRKKTKASAKDWKVLACKVILTRSRAVRLILTTI